MLARTVSFRLLTDVEDCVSRGSVVELEPLRPEFIEFLDPSLDLERLRRSELSRARWYHIGFIIGTLISAPEDDDDDDDDDGEEEGDEEEGV